MIMQSIIVIVFFKTVSLWIILLKFDQICIYLIGNLGIAEIESFRILFGATVFGLTLINVVVFGMLVIATNNRNEVAQIVENPLC